jgi:tape measure domain-containing protein
MAKIVKELVTKWTYRVDTVQLQKATRNVLKLKKSILDVRKSSVSFGKQEKGQLRAVGMGWKRATKEVDRYTRAKRKAFSARGGSGGGGFFGRGGGRRTGSAFAGGGSGRLATLASTLGGGALGGLLIAGGGAAGAGALGFAGAVGLAGQKEQAKASIGGLLGGGPEGAAQAEKVLATLSEFAKKTPFQITQLRELASVLLAGGFQATELVDTLRTMGDVTRGNNDKLNRMLFNFVQIKTMGRATAMDLRQFAMAGIPIYKQLGEQLGKNGEQLAEMTRKGKITFDVVKEAFRQMTSEGGLFFQGMELQSATLFGIFSNIKDGIMIIGEAIGDEFLEDVKKVSEAFKEWIDENKIPIVERVKNFVSSMKQFKDIVMGVDESMSHLTTTVRVLGGVLAFAFARANPMLTAFLVTLTAIDDIMNGLRGNKSVTKDIIDSVEEKGVAKTFADKVLGPIIKHPFFKTEEGEERAAKVSNILAQTRQKMIATRDMRLKQDRMAAGFVPGEQGPIAPSNLDSSSTTNNNINANFNQNINNQGQGMSTDEVLGLGQEMFNMYKEEVRVKASN